MNPGWVLLQPSSASLDWTIELVALPANNCQRPDEYIVRRVVRRSYTRGEVIRSEPNIRLIDLCEGFCRDPETTCAPCGEFARAGVPLPPGCPDADESRPVCVRPEDAPFRNVTDESTQDPSASWMVVARSPTPVGSTLMTSTPPSTMLRRASQMLARTRLASTLPRPTTPSPTSTRTLHPTPVPTRAPLPTRVATRQVRVCRPAVITPCSVASPRAISAAQPA